MKIQEIAEVKVIDGKLSMEGAFSPVHLMNIMNKYLKENDFIPKGFLACYIHRIYWPLSTVLQINEGLPMTPEITGHDTIALSYENAYERISFLFLDMGVEVIPLCMIDDKSITFTKTYESKIAKFIAVPHSSDWKKVKKMLNDVPLIDKVKLKNQYEGLQV